VLALGRIARRLLWANPGRLIVLLAGAVSVALAASGILLAASTSLAVVHQTVEAGWRGTYDLLVRPADAPSLQVDGHSVVPLDYLGLRTSGITREQWQRIARLPNVEVAAPVAALGWLKGDTPGVTVELAGHTPGVVYQVEAHAKIGGQDALHLTGLIAFRNNRDEVDIGFRDYIGADPVILGFGDVPATWGLVVGIDPTSENALMGLSDYVEGSYLSSGASEVFDNMFRRTAVEVPVLTAARSPIPGDLSVTVSRVDGVTVDQVQALYNHSGHEVGEPLNAAIEGLVATGKVTRLSGDDQQLADLLQPLRLTGVVLGPDSRLASSTTNLSGSASDENVVLVPSLAGYGSTSDPASDLALAARGAWQDLIDPQLAAVRPEGWWPPEATFGGDATVYRDLKVTVPPAFKLVPVGTYDRNAIDAHYGAAANDAPLGIYADIARTLLTDASGKPVNQALPLSINPGGLNPQPPVGLTNLEAVEALRGAQFIDAIRVRVAGISGYTPAAVRRIETVAAQIVAETGLHVDVVAGSSPVDLRVAVPGVGTMAERWTTLGTAAEIVSGAEGLSALLLAAALLVVVAYLAAFGLFLTGDQAAEIGILRRVGWRRRSLVTLVAIQALALGSLAAALTVGLVAGLAAVASQHVSGWALAAAAVAVLAAHPLAAGLAGFARLGRASGEARQHPRPARIRGALLGLALTFAREAPARTLVAGTATALALAVAGLVAAVEVAAGGELRATIFGAVVSVRLAPYHLLAAAAALFAAGALILDGALLTVERRLALIGTLRAVGWRSGAIRRLVTLETTLPALVAGLVAAVLVGVVAWWLGLGWMALALAVGVLALAVLLAMVATQLPAGVAVHTPPAVTLRAEGASAVVGGFAPRQAILTVAALVVIVSLVAGGWGAAEGAASALPPFVAPTQHPLSDTAKRIQADVQAIASGPDRVAGSVSFELALGQIDRGLTAAGWRVQTTAYLSRRPTFLDAQGSPVELAGLTVSLAYDADAWDGRDLDLPATFVDASRAMPRSCPTGITVLRVADFGQVAPAAQLQQRCQGRTAAVLSVKAEDEAWIGLSHGAARVRLPVAHFLTASSPAATSVAPWLVVTLDSIGPGASQSAAPAAVMLEVARQAAAEHLPLRVAVASASDGASGSVLLRQVAATPAGSMLWLGSMGGPVASVLGTTAMEGVDAAASSAGLLLIAGVDAGFGEWLARASHPSDQATSQALLTTLSDQTHLAARDEASWNTSALAIGRDAAYLGEPALPSIGPPSVAGTPADTAAQIRAGDLEQLASGILAALKEMDQ
jgi:hypothetical protein